MGSTQNCCWKRLKLDFVRIFYFLYNFKHGSCSKSQFNSFLTPDFFHDLMTCHCFKNHRHFLRYCSSSAKKSLPVLLRRSAHTLLLYVRRRCGCTNSTNCRIPFSTVHEISAKNYWYTPAAGIRVNRILLDVNHLLVGR